MYNRYIPGPDGSYRKNRMPEHLPEPIAPPPEPPIPVTESEITTPPAAPQPLKMSQQRPHTPQIRSEPVGSFLKNLLPKSFDTSDLIIVLLLLLMAGDSPEDQNTAMLTMALYCFL